MNDPPRRRFALVDQALQRCPFLVRKADTIRFHGSARLDRSDSRLIKTSDLCDER
jgi:hypothetical protein